ncbi:MAG TPA: GspMb/PilO family protein [Terriglobales bacterium]|nr:GspMb/PilO family protein [Terriglobales bacterium]
MANLAATRKNFETAAWIMGIVAIIAALLVFLPLRPSAEQKAAELNEANLKAKQLESEVNPLRGLPEKLVKARTDISTFYKERLPERFSAIPETLGELSSDHDVHLSDVKYETNDTNFPGIQEVTMEATLSGDYASVVHFINSLERSKVFLLIDKVTLAEEGATGAGDVRLQIRLLSVLRPQVAPGNAAPKATGARTL